MKIYLPFFIFNFSVFFSNKLFEIISSSDINCQLVLKNNIIITNIFLKKKKFVMHSSESCLTYSVAQYNTKAIILMM